MQPVVRLLAALALCCLLIGRSAAFNADRRQDVSNPILAISVLQDLIQAIEEDNNLASANKRRFDGGYGSRYGVAQSVGSKLMALKQAADWNGPGRKRREA